MRIINTEKEQYKTYAGKIQTKTTTTVYSNDNRGICEVINWGDNGDTSVRFFKGGNKLKAEYRADYGSLDSATKACEAFFKSIAA